VVAWGQPQLGGGLRGDVGGQPGRTVGLLVGADTDRRSTAVELGDRHLDGIARAAVWLVAVYGDSRRVKTATAASPATTSGPGLPCHAVPHVVVSTPSASAAAD
jgi:hypothetical protein